MKLFILSLLLLCGSCTTSFKSPVTQIEYTGEISKEGLSIKALPPFWSYCCDLYNWLFTDNLPAESELLESEQ